MSQDTKAKAPKAKLKSAAPLGLPGQVLARYKNDQGLRQAASLSYTSLLSLIPLLTIAFAMLAAFPGFEGVREQILAFLLDNLVMQDRDQIEVYFNNFLSNAGKMGAVGVVGFAVTALLLLSTIEGAMNGIFRVSRPRPILVRVLIYWALLTLGPVLLGSSFTLSGYVTTLLKFDGAEALAGPLGKLAIAGPTLITMLAFMLFYMAMPNRPVNWKHALTGAVVASLLFAFLRWAFALYVISFPSYKAVYGAISSIPIFLIWMYLSWAVILFGATVTATLAERRGRHHLLNQGFSEHGRRLWLAANLLKLMDEKSHGEGGDIQRRTLIDAAGAGDMEVDRMLDLLADEDYITRTENNRWVLARNAESTTLADLHKILDLPLGPLPAITEQTPAWAGRMMHRLERSEKTQAAFLSTPLREIFHGDDLPAEDEPQHSNPAIDLMGPALKTSDLRPAPTEEEPIDVEPEILEPLAENDPADGLRVDPTLRPDLPEDRR
ncbi:YihY family inner membrane protein [Magnetospira sp. QH-2]|uniref:YihY family inner membrane protein n=1 Tax=Magnetospira sp. (strain QH-2) TaxID=1288970 RepID=UPI0003E817E8|nr:YihY family inner membrane protein [Magnetospira sp. QH-2]CCQ73562.1 Putative tRNA-processing ribonuclease BN [Magnetospira sp. QH-2]